LVEKSYINEPNEIKKSGRLKKIYTIKKPFTLTKEEKEELFDEYCTSGVTPKEALSTYHNKKLEELMKPFTPFVVLRWKLCGFIEVKDGIVKVPKKTIERLKKFLLDSMEVAIKDCVEEIGREETTKHLKKILKKLEIENEV